MIISFAGGWLLCRGRGDIPPPIDGVRVDTVYAAPDTIKIKLPPSKQIVYVDSIKVDTFRIVLPGSVDTLRTSDTTFVVVRDSLPDTFMGVIPHKYLLMSRDRFSIRYWDFRNLVWKDDIYSTYRKWGFNASIEAGYFNHILTTAYGDVRYNRHHFIVGYGAVSDGSLVRTSPLIKYKYDLLQL
jgi:hypothetical protein